MVQMKGETWQYEIEPEDNFISHMVQMKEGTLDYKIFLCELYIPHGSDESNITLIYLTL